MSFIANSSFTIQNVERVYTIERISQILDKLNIARNCFISPIECGRKKHYNVFVLVYEWADSEIAYNFMNRLKGKSYARIVYKSDAYWNASYDATKICYRFFKLEQELNTEREQITREQIIREQREYDPTFYDIEAGLHDGISALCASKMVY
jgi:hypothetical protein